MKKSYQITGSMAILIMGVLLLGTDRLFVSADTGSYFQSVTILTTISLFFLLAGAIWLFKVTFK